VPAKALDEVLAALQRSGAVPPTGEAGPSCQVAAKRPAGQRCHPSLSLRSPAGQLPEIDGRGGEEGLDLHLRAPTELRPSEPMGLLGFGVEALADHLAPAKLGSATPGPCACSHRFDAA
jgi:hypothetical protein